MKIIVNKTEGIPFIFITDDKLKYAIKVNDKIVISPLPLEAMIEKISDFSYISGGVVRKVYNPNENIALENFVIETYFGSGEVV